MAEITTEMTKIGAMQWPEGVDPYPGTMRIEHACIDCGLAMELPLFVWIKCDCDGRWWALRPADGGHLQVVDTRTDPTPPAPRVSAGENA